MTYSPTKFEVATSNGLGGDTFTRNVTDGRTHGRTDGRTDRRTDGRRTDFDTKLIYPFFLKKKAGIIILYIGVEGNCHARSELARTSQKRSSKQTATSDKGPPS